MNTYHDLLKIVKNPKMMLGHFLCENLNQETFVCPEDNNMEIRVFVGDNQIINPHDLNEVLTDWVKRWVDQIIEENYNFKDFRKSVEEEAAKLSEERTQKFFRDMYELHERMETKMTGAFSEVQCLDAFSYSASKEKDARIAELETQVLTLSLAAEAIKQKDLL